MNADDARELRAWAKRERAEERRLDRLPPEAPFTPSPAQQRRLDRQAERVARRVRLLAERALRAMGGNRWDDALSDLIDAAAVLRDLGGLVPSRGGHTVISAKEWDEAAG